MWLLEPFIAREACDGNRSTEFGDTTDAREPPKYARMKRTNIEYISKTVAARLSLDLE